MHATITRIITRMGTWRQLGQHRDWWGLPQSQRAERFEVARATHLQCGPLFNDDLDQLGLDKV